ncbi:MAG: LysR family transcriptional regulator [Pseudomonadota bacterium]
MRYLLIGELIEGVAKAGSIRKAAEALNITASALNRRIQQFEDEFGTPIFERVPGGVRLNPAGEIIMHHIISQRADFERVREAVAALVGERQGHVRIACSQAVVPTFLPGEIARYREGHPGVLFTVNVRDRIAAERDLAAFEADLALVFEPVHMADFEIIAAVEQPICAVMAADHPLASKPDLRLRDCLDVPHITPAERFGVRVLLDHALRRSARRLSPVTVSDSFEFLRSYVLREKVVGFEIGIGIMSAESDGLLARPLPADDVPVGHLLLGHLKSRTLPVAAARFAEQLTAAFERIRLTDEARHNRP